MIPAEEKPRNWARMTPAEKQRWYYARAHQGSGIGAAQKGFDYKGKHWTQQPENKARVRKLAVARRQAFLAKTKPHRKKADAKWQPATGPARKAMPKGFWLAEVTKLLKQRPRPQRELSAALIDRYPKKRDAIFVVLAGMKAHKEIIEVDGRLELPAVNGAANMSA